MLHNTLSALLVSVASRYAKLSPSDVGIGIGGGRLVVDDVQLRTDTLNGPGTPFEILHGRAGRLRVHVPWGALTSSPVKVYLENVHLIASPKKHSQSSSSSPTPPPSSKLQNPYPWHQTNVGRLLFNVSVELYGLKVEYRDTACVGVLSIASLYAFSAGPDWTEQFASLDSYEDDDDIYDQDDDDLDGHTHQQSQASAVAMRKSVKLTGVHFVMIPRAKKNIVLSSSDPTSKQQEQQHKQGEQQQQQQELQQHPRNENERNLDLSSFESANPILDGVSIALRVLLCTGAQHVAVDNGGVGDAQENAHRNNVGKQRRNMVLKPGMHGEVFIEMDEPSVKLTARQLLWLEHILRQALGEDSDDNINRNSSSNSSTSKNDKEASHAQSNTVQSADEMNSPQVIDSDGSKRPRVSVSMPDLADDTQPSIKDKHTHHTQEKPDLSAQHPKSVSNPDIDTAGLSNGTTNTTLKAQTNKQGRFRSFWETIVGENIDDTVDDAAIALGLWTLADTLSHDHKSKKSKSRKKSKSVVSSDPSNDGDVNDDAHDNAEEGDDDDENDDENDDSYQVRRVRHVGFDGDDLNGGDDNNVADSDDEDEDVGYARRAVAAAVACGGVSWHVRLRTADTKAWDRVHELERQLEDAARVKERLSFLEESSSKSELREKDLKSTRDDLVQRNANLAKELKELEQMTARAARNKDEIIRQLQAALGHAQRNLQAFYEQEQLQMHDQPHQETDDDVNRDKQQGEQEQEQDTGREQEQQFNAEGTETVVGTNVGVSSNDALSHHHDFSASKPGLMAHVPIGRESITQAVDEQQKNPPPLAENSDRQPLETSSANTAPITPSLAPSPPPPPPPPFPYDAPYAGDADPVPPPPAYPPPTYADSAKHSFLPSPPEIPPTVLPLPEAGTPLNQHQQDDADESETGTVVVNDDAEDVAVLPDDNGGLMTRSDGEQPLGQERNEMVKDDEHVNDDVDVVQHASLQAFYNDDNDLNKLEQRMGVQGLTLI